MKIIQNIIIRHINLTDKIEIIAKYLCKYESLLGYFNYSFPGIAPDEFRKNKIKNKDDLQKYISIEILKEFTQKKKERKK